MKPFVLGTASLTVLPLMAAGAAGSQSTALSRGMPERPNIVFLLFDDLGYGDLGCYGQSLIETPNIDALAKSGILFTDMYTACPLSAPSRCSILTGLHSGHSQIRGNDERWPRPEGMVLKDADWYFDAIHDNPELEGQWPLAPGTPTIASMLHDAGYATAMIGKWGLGGPGSGSTPNDCGFDYFYGFNCQMLAHSYYPDYLWENGTKVYTRNSYMPVNRRLDPGADPLDPRSYDKFNQKDYSCDLMFDKLDKWITDNAGGPFFLMWTTTVPHSTVQAPEDEVMYYVDKLHEEKTPITDGGWYYPVLYPHSAYAAMITHIDTQLGKVVQKLKDLGIYDNTLIIISSDNGPAANSNSPGEYFNSGGPFKCRKGWGKSSLHEGGIRMPFIVSWGSRLKPGRSSYMGQFTDLMPTLAELSGASCPTTDGISFAHALKGKRQPRHQHLYWEFPGGKGWLAVREGYWKGLVKNVHNGNDSMELYDLQNDPRESTDVASLHPDIVKRMWEIIEAEHTEVPNHNPVFEIEIPSAGARTRLLVGTDMSVNFTDGTDTLHTPAEYGEDSTVVPDYSAYILTPKAPDTPRINGPKIYGARPKADFLYRIPATGVHPMTFSAKGLPRGLRLDPHKGIISGKASKKGSYNVTLTATNALGSDSRTLRIEIGDRIALTPPLGWNSWNCWGNSVSQELMLQSARIMDEKGLADYGWSYVNIDDGWQGVRGGKYNAIQPNKKFPDMKALADSLHARGLKFGIYSGPWCSTYASHIGSSCDNADGTYWWVEQGMTDEYFKLDRSKLDKEAIRNFGKYSFAGADARQWADWGVDYLKYDWNPNDEWWMRDMRQALDATGRDIVYSISNSARVTLGPVLLKYAECWRTTGDIRDTWESMSTIGFEGQDRWAGFRSPGHWPDADMLVLGKVGWGRKMHWTQLTPWEQYTHITLWSILASPMLLGCDMAMLDDFTLSLLCNSEVLDVNQDALGIQGVKFASGEGHATYVKPLEDGSLAVALFNLGEEECTLGFVPKKLGIFGEQTVRDLWRQKDVGKVGYKERWEVSVPAHGCAFYRLSPGHTDHKLEGFYRK